MAVPCKKLLESGVNAIKCECGGYSKRVNLKEHEFDLGCHRERMFRKGCCIGAFICCICHTRYVARYEEYFEDPHAEMDALFGKFEQIVSREMLDAYCEKINRHNSD